MEKEFEGKVMRDKKKMIKRILTSNDWRIRYILATPIGRALPDKIYVRLKYRAFLHKKIDLQTPFTFNEKLQWLKLYDRNPLYTTLVDKYAVRQYIKEKRQRGLKPCCLFSFSVPGSVFSYFILFSKTTYSSASISAVPFVYRLVSAS